jgi:hypothetical protein
MAYRLLIGSLLATTALWGWSGSSRLAAQTQPNALVIQGGTLVDGNGGPPSSSDFQAPRVHHGGRYL